MLSGEVIDDRFELQACAGVGGMGSVYRALDRVTNQLVALKVLNEESEKTTMRFTKEAQVLAALEHPHIVRYVAHGFAASGEPYLAMEWLEGEELEARLHRERLGIAATIDLGLRVARALAVAHMQGVVHRDIKPSNIFLVQSDIERVKILDFGLARLRGKTVLTQTGSIIGTPGYMSPEQARGDRGRIDARADVFSLACVLYECVTGQPAFMGAHVMAVLAKVLLEEAPSARTLCPEIPKEFDKLLGRMLSKNPAMRPADGREVAEALERIAQQYRSETNQDGPPSLSMTSDESRLVSLVTVLPLPMLPDAEPASMRPHDVFELVRRTLKPFKAAVEPFGTGGVVAVFDGVGNAGDQVAVAARSAVRIKDVVTSHVVAVFTGRSTAANPLAVGELVDRMMTFAQSVSTVSVLRRWNGGILIDDTTRSLLGSRFLVGESSGFWILQRERAHDYLKRSVLGRPVPCVGRERDLRSMLDYIDGAFEQSSARAILMLGPPGIGKSRLRLEILDRVRESVRDIFVISGRGDWLGLGSVFGLVGGALRAALSLDSVKTEAQQRDLLVEASSICGEADRIRVAAFLGEMLGIPFPDDAHPRLFEARANASIMADAIQEAFVDFMRAKAMMSPVLLVLEDLHWGDMPSTRLVDAVLREIGQLPIVVLGLGRPEVHEAFPGLWQGRAVQSVRLGRLSKKAAEAMIGAILGDSIDRAHIDAIVERADGNAFFIEELSRAVASGRADSLPETVAGMVETRIMSLPPALRLALRAASIFGRTFRPDGAAALIDQTLRNGAAGIIFDELVDREFLERKSSNRQFGPDELAFRQALIQQAAYGMLTERDRTIGHKLAAEWLESMGEPDPMTLAEHFARGGEPARAVGYYLGAARQALHGGDDRAALERVKRALVCGAEGETQAALLAIQYEALRSANPNAILNHAEALFAANRMKEAKAVLGYLLSDLLAQAQAIKDPESRRFFWQNVPMRARAFELAKLWGLERA